MSFEHALDHLNIRKRPGDFEGSIVTKAIDEDDLRHPNQSFQVPSNILLLVIGQDECGKRNHKQQCYQERRRM